MDTPQARLSRGRRYSKAAPNSAVAQRSSANKMRSMDTVVQPALVPTARPPLGLEMPSKATVEHDQSELNICLAPRR